MQLNKIRFKGKKQSSKGKGLVLGSEAVPLIKLHHYSRLPEAQNEEEYDWHAARPLDLNAPSRPTSTKTTQTKKEKRRTKILNLIFPTRLGDLATAWRLQIETANGICVPVTAGDIVMLRPIYSVGGRDRQRGSAGRGRVCGVGEGSGSWSGGSAAGRESVGLNGKGKLKGDGTVAVTWAGSSRGKGSAKRKVRFVFEGEVVRQVVDDVDLGNGEGSSKSGETSTGASKTGVTAEKGRSTGEEEGKTTARKGWATAGEFGMFL